MADTDTSTLAATDVAKIVSGSDTMPASFAGYPKFKYHPVLGAIEVKDPNEMAALQPPHDYFDTAEEADMHRTDREAGQVIAHNVGVKVQAKLAGKPVDLSDPVQAGSAGVVRNSVAATENLKAGGSEPL